MNPAPECKWGGCTAQAIGGVTSYEKDPSWVMPLCGNHLMPFSPSLWRGWELSVVMEESA